jgi:type I restriction enzyme S subunit
MSRSVIATNYSRAEHMPTDWALGRLKNLLRRKITDGPHSTPVFLTEGVPFLSVDGIKDGELCFKKCRFISAEDYSEFRKKADPEKGDILLGKAASTGKVAIVRSTRTFSIWSPLALIKLDKSKACPTYVWYSMGAKFFQAEIDDYCTSNTQKNISMDDIPRLPLFIPPLFEQRQIAAYLNRETAKIDKLIAKQQKLIKLLQEKRQAVISQAVTKGLNPNVKFTDSGIDWLGQVPAHWKVRPMKQVCKIGNGSTPKRDNLEYWDEGSFPWLNSSCVNEEEVNTARHFVTEKALAECHLPKVSAPAVLVGITGQGRTRGMATTLKIDATINQHVAFLQPLSDELSISFLRRFIDASYSWLRYDSEGAGSTKGAITCMQLGNLRITIPPQEEQAQINRVLSDRLASIALLIEKANSSLELLLQRRAAVITAAVTGKIDVRGLVTEQEVAALDADPVMETTEEDFESEVEEADYITEEE